MSQETKKNSEVKSTNKTVAINYHCNKCEASVDNVRIRCADCEDFDLCITCFTLGTEIDGHKNDHSYRVLGKHTFPVIDEKWGADEELLLLEGSTVSGVGNWEDIAEHIGTKTKQECEEHYYKYYLNSETWPLPQLNKEFDSEIDTLKNRKFNKVILPTDKVLISSPLNHEILGFMPGRLEFETEFENEAENLIKDLCFNEDDTAEDIEFKLTVLDIYNSKTLKREIRKKFICQRGLLNYKKYSQLERRRTKPEKSLFNKVKSFARIMTSEDFNDFYSGLVNDLNLKKRLMTLQEMRKNGFKNLAEGEQYMNEVEERRNLSVSPINASQIKMDFEHPNYSSKMIKDGKPIGRKSAPPLDISNADGVELLMPEEQQLCSVLRILPKPYMVIKESILKEFIKNGSLRRRDIRNIIHIDVNKTGRLYDFFKRMGWLNFTNQ